MNDYLMSVWWKDDILENKVVPIKNPISMQYFDVGRYLEFTNSRRVCSKPVSHFSFFPYSEKNPFITDMFK